MDDVDVILRKMQGKAEVRFLPGVYRGLDEYRRAIVDFSGGRVPAYVLVGPPEINEPVWVEVVDGVAYMHGPTVPKPDEGTITTATAGVATITTAIGAVSAQYDEGLLTPGPGDVVRLTWGPSGAFILGVTTEAVAPEIPTVAVTTGRQTREFTAVDSGSYQPGYGWRTNEVWSSANNSGAWFYGNTIADTIPDTARIVGAQIFLPNPKRLLGARPFGRHTSAAKPGSAVTIIDATTLPRTDGWTDIPTGLVDALKVAPGGLGFAYGGYNIWPGTQGDGDSGKLRVTYEI